MFNADYLWSGYANTLKVCFMGWALSISAVVLCAYPLSKKDLPFRGIFTTIVIVTMFVSGGLIPTYLLVTNTLGMKNTYWAILLPHIVSVSHIVIARNFFMGLPAGLEEAATIDGANSWQILFKVMLPLSTPVLATISLWVVVSNWNAYFNCLLYITDSSKYVLQVVLRRIILTASGGPFRTLPASAFAQITPEQACAHPTWAMGRKISVDSATMMNKGLEVIEARWLFDLPGERIEAIIHPQSVVHSLVEYVDGSLLAQLGQPDMRTPIACALAWPQRIEAGVGSLDFTQLAALEFHAPDTERFPCLRLAYDALAAGGTAPTVLNAANEVAVEAFLARRLPFPGIAQTIRAVLDALPVAAADSLDALQEADARARETARQHLQQTP
ncbi:MAG: ABC transporter permease subunit [Rhodocyclaceae bacterium]|nr:ABC transporter permease subunit [Rhodocyclaceae bacterium]